MSGSDCTPKSPCKAEVGCNSDAEASVVSNGLGAMFDSHGVSSGDSLGAGCIDSGTPA